MNRIVAIAPVALLTSACAVHGPARTPATALDASAAVDAPTHEVVLPADGEAIAAWRLPTDSPWSHYEKVTLLTYLAGEPVGATMPEIEALPVVQQAELAAARVAGAGLPKGTMWVVDLRGVASVAFGATLSQRSARPVANVMTFNNWPAEHELVPAEQTLAALVGMRPRPLPPGPVDATPVFLLDAWRLALRGAEPVADVIDNRYALLAADFPDPATLRAQGIHRVVYVVEDRALAGVEEDDFNEVALAYQAAGIRLVLVDLAELGSLDQVDPDQQDEAWAACFDRWAYTVEERTTLLDDLSFYLRARGGFGGLRAAPSRAFGGGAGPMGGRTYSAATPHVVSGSGG